MILFSGAVLTIHDELQIAIIGEPFPSLSTDPKRKRARSPSPVKEAGKAKKIKGPSFPSDPTSSSSKAPIVEAIAEVMLPLDLEITTMAGAGEALEGKKG